MRLRSITAAVSAGAIAAMALAGPAFASTCVIGTYSDPNGLTSCSFPGQGELIQNMWNWHSGDSGDISIPGGLFAWYADFTDSSNSGVQGYPEVQGNPAGSAALSSLSTGTATVNWGWTATPPSTDSEDVALDTRLNSTTGPEVMFWVGKYNTSPAGTLQSGDSVVTSTGTYDLYADTSAHIYTWVRQGNTGSTTVHMLTLFNALATDGFISSSDTWVQSNWGVELGKTPTAVSWESSSLTYSVS